MKRVVLAIGLMGAALPAVALDPEVNLGGTFALSLSWYEDHTDTLDTTDVDLENNGSNFRVQAGAEEQGIRAFMVYERGASNDQLGVEDVREFYAGVNGRLGTLVAGRKATDYRLAGERLDPFYNTSVASFNGLFSSEGASFGLSNLTNGYTSNTVAYRSPAFAGVSINGGLYVNNNNSQQGGGDDPDVGLGVSYVNADWLGLDAGVQFLDINGVPAVVTNGIGESTAIRVHASLGTGPWSVGASYEQIDVAFESNPRKYAFVSASYQMFDAMRLAVTAGSVSDTPSTDGAGGSIGMLWDVTKYLQAYAALRYATLDNVVNENTATLASGIKFSFDKDL